MPGFFDIPQTKNRRRVGCASCGLYAEAKSPRMPPFGEFKKLVMTIGESAGQSEDERNKPWQGKTGQLLERTLERFDIDLFKDCVSINSVQCRCHEKGENRQPTPTEIACCQSRVISQIKEYKPHLVLLLGGSAIESVMGYRAPNEVNTNNNRKKGVISRWRGWHIPDREFNAWICPVFHPSYVERGEREIHTIWKSDLEQALAYWQKPLPKFEDDATKVQIVEDLSILSALKSPVAWDLETTGLKPHAIGHKIISMSASDGNTTVAFLMPEKDSRNWKRIKRFLLSDVGKIASNLKFETQWTKHFFDCEPKNWIWDTMLASHVLDNRPDINSIKFQALVRCGIVDYSSEISPYLKADDNKNANAFNRIGELLKTETNKRKLLVYNGLDSLLEWQVAAQQMQEFGRISRLSSKDNA